MRQGGHIANSWWNRFFHNMTDVKIFDSLAEYLKDWLPLASVPCCKAGSWLGLMPLGNADSLLRC